MVTKTSPINSVGPMLKLLRKKANLTQETVAKTLNTTRSCIARVEKEDSNPTISTINKYANACGAQFSYFTKGLDE